MKPTVITTLLFICISLNIHSQTDRTRDSAMIRAIFNKALTDGKSYEWLEHLATRIGGRLSGSPEAEKAVAYTREELEALGLDEVWLQPVMVPKWTRGEPETARIETSDGKKIPVAICALGGSVATPDDGLKAQLVEIHGLDGLRAMDREQVEGKIVFFNQPMDPVHIETFRAYGQSIGQRYSGAMEAAQKGAVGVIVRSMSLRIDEHPHTGAMSYGDLPEGQHIPAAAISTLHAELLSQVLGQNPDLEFWFRQTCQTQPDVESYNVIGEVTGSVHPDRYIIVGGHLDAWDNGQGAHDDGAGCVQSMEVLRIFKKLGYKPKHTIRVVLFMNEENGLRGGRKYAEEARKKNETHVFALESDVGGFTPRGFSFDCTDGDYEKIEAYKPLFEPYLTDRFVRGGSGADINPLKDGTVVLSGLRPDSQRYFDIHHAATDTFDSINRRELELGAAAMAGLIYLIDRYGTEMYPVKN